ncbi:hypothetical protein U9M48_001080 [Paspalum notatum var. saurae]|uniref:TMEM205-like domain-containing protein n=1 Tax=Paspalum notatum var. saurae TaxID=547442 RepID=A0AAQ3PEI6_PASNO
MGWAARFLTAASFLAAGVLFAPRALRLGRSGDGAPAAASRLAHLLAFAIAWGAALWVSSVGASVMFNITRKVHCLISCSTRKKNIQPPYRICRDTSLGVCREKCSIHSSIFMLISVCSAISVAAFAYVHPWKASSTIERYQLGFLILALGCNLSNLLVFTPMMVEMMTKKYKMEKDLGIGTEVGYSRNVEMAKKSPALAAMKWKFRMIHVLSTLASLMAFGSLAMHSWYLSSKLDL